MSILVDGQKVVRIKYHYLEIEKQQSYTVFKFLKTEEDFKKHRDDKNLKELNTTWKIPTWEEQTTLLRLCTVYDNKDGSITARLDFLRLDDLVLKTYLKGWDFKDEQGNPVPVDQDVINKLNPTVARELINGFEMVTNIQDRDLKNS